MKRYVIVKCDTTEELENKVSEFMKSKPHGPNNLWWGHYKPQGAAFQVQEGPTVFRICQPMVFDGKKALKGWNEDGSVKK